MFTDGQPTITPVLRKDAETHEERISIVIGELRALHFSIRNGRTDVRDRAVSSNEQIKKLQKILGEIIRENTKMIP